MPPLNRVLVVLPNWFGETLFATPFLRALRRQRPAAWIATLGHPRCREVLLHNAHVDARLDYDEQGAHRGPIGKWRLVRSLGAHRVDTAFILRRSLSRSLLLALAGIPARVGCANAKSGWLLTHHVPAPPACRADAKLHRASLRGAGRREPRHKAATYLPLLEAVGLSGAEESPLVYDYTVSEEERDAARGLLERLGVSDGRPIVILHPGANWAHKRWASERFAALGDRLAAGESRVVITGGPDDHAMAESIRRAMRQPAAVLAGATSLRQLAACLAQAQLVISNDTGVLHIAAALGRPLVALYGPTSPALTGPLGDPRRMVVLHHPECCPRVPCTRPDHPPHPGMDSITVEEAHAAASQLLASTPKSAPA